MSAEEVRRRRCGDCRVLPGEPHTTGCDVARCRITGWQALVCNGHHIGGCWGGIWTGKFPGEAECIEFGLLTGEPRSWWDPPVNTPDLNALAALAMSGRIRWDIQQSRWVR